MRRILFPTLFVSVLAFAGCRLNLLELATASPVGTYSLDRASIEQAIAAEVGEQPSPSSVREAYQNRKRREELTQFLAHLELRLTLEADGTWREQAGFGPGFNSITNGTWVHQNGKIRLTTSHEDGSPLSIPRTDELIFSDGSIRYPYRSGDKDLEIVLQRDLSSGPVPPVTQTAP